VSEYFSVKRVLLVESDDLLSVSGVRTVTVQVTTSTDESHSGTSLVSSGYKDEVKLSLRDHDMSDLDETTNERHNPISKLILYKITDVDFIEEVL